MKIQQSNYTTRHCRDLQISRRNTEHAKTARPPKNGTAIDIRETFYRKNVPNHLNF